MIVVGYTVTVENKTYKYTAIRYPYGFTSKTKLVGFNDDSIVKVIHKGYEINNFNIVKETVNTVYKNHQINENQKQGGDSSE